MTPGEPQASAFRPLKGSRVVAALLMLMFSGAALAAASETPQPNPTPTPAPAQLAGRIQLQGTDGRLTSGEGTVVWIPGVAGAAPPTSPRVESRSKRFAPHVAAVPAGTVLAFPNLDPIYHNVFSRSPGSEFDLGLYRRGASRSVRLRNPGLVRIYCNIHPQMAAYVMVLEQPSAFAVAGEDGSYRIPDLPPGRPTVRMWNEKGGEQEFRVHLAPGGRQTLDAVLDISSYRRVQHKNKYGKDYPPVREDDDRY